MSRALPRRSFLSSMLYPRRSRRSRSAPRAWPVRSPPPRKRGPPPRAATPDRRRGVLARDPAGLRGRPQPGQPQQRGISPTPRPVMDSLFRHWNYENELPPYTMWQVLEPQREGVRQQLARFAGVSPEEIALTRNASEALETVQLGLPHAAGDEVLTTTRTTRG